MELEVVDKQLQKIFEGRYIVQVWTNMHGKREMLYQQIFDRKIKNWAIDIKSFVFIYTLELGENSETDYTVVALQDQKVF